MNIPSRPRGLPLRARVVEIFALALCLTLALLVTRNTPTGAIHWNVILAIGYLLFAGTLAESLLSPLRLPHLTAYIAVGIVGGPHVLRLVDHETVAQLIPVNTLAISLIALAGGLELEAKLLIVLAKSLFWSNLVQTVVVGASSTAAFLLLSRYVPFAAQLPFLGLVGVSLIWGLLATSRSPSATLAVLSQTRAHGPLARWSLSFVMSSDIVVVMLSTLLFVAVRPWLVEGTDLSVARLLVLAQEIVGSMCLGLCLGLLLAAYLRFVGQKLMLVLLVLGFVVTDGLKYVHFDPLLAFLVTGFVVSNLSQQGRKLLDAVSKMSGMVFVVFFATAGVHLDLSLLSRLWPVALAFFLVRLASTVVAGRFSARIAKDAPVVRRFGFAPLVSQAGLTLALSQNVEREFPQLGVGFRALVVATVAINEIIGPILFKLSLDHAGETSERVQDGRNAPEGEGDPNPAAAALEGPARVGERAGLSDG